MKNKLSKALITATTLALSTFSIQSAQAAIINYAFTVDIDSGVLNGQSYAGSFSYNDAGLTGIGNESVALSAINFNFLDVNYDQNDGTTPDALFLDNDFLGLSWSEDQVQFSFVPGFFDLDEAFFAYDIANGSGAGDINFALQPEGDNIPESNSVIGLLLLGGLGTISLMKRSQT